MLCCKFVSAHSTEKYSCQIGATTGRAHDHHRIAQGDARNLHTVALIEIGRWFADPIQLHGLLDFFFSLALLLRRIYLIGPLFRLLRAFTEAHVETTHDVL